MIGRAFFATVVVLLPLLAGRGEAAIEIVVAVDTSRSVRWTDPGGVRLALSAAVLDHLRGSDATVAVTRYAGWSETGDMGPIVLQPTPAGRGREFLDAAATALAGLEAEGEASDPTRAVLDAVALPMWQREGAARYLVLLTDGGVDGVEAHVRDTYLGAAGLDPTREDIRRAVREAMRTEARPALDERSIRLLVVLVGQGSCDEATIELAGGSEHALHGDVPGDGFVALAETLGPHLALRGPYATAMDDGSGGVAAGAFEVPVFDGADETLVWVIGAPGVRVLPPPGMGGSADPWQCGGYSRLSVTGVPPGRYRFALEGPTSPPRVAAAFTRLQLRPSLQVAGTGPVVRGTTVEVAVALSTEDGGPVASPDTVERLAGSVALVDASGAVLCEQAVAGAACAGSTQTLHVAEAAGAGRYRLVYRARVEGLRRPIWEGEASAEIDIALPAPLLRIEDEDSSGNRRPLESVTVDAAFPAPFRHRVPVWVRASIEPGETTEVAVALDPALPLVGATLEARDGGPLRLAGSAPVPGWLITETDSNEPLPRRQGTLAFHGDVGREPLVAQASLEIRYARERPPALSVLAEEGGVPRPLHRWTVRARWPEPARFERPVWVAADLLPGEETLVAADIAAAAGGLQAAIEAGDGGPLHLRGPDPVAARLVLVASGADPLPAEAGCIRLHAPFGHFDPTAEVPVSFEYERTAPPALHVEVERGGTWIPLDSWPISIRYAERGRYELPVRIGATLLPGEEVPVDAALDPPAPGVAARIESIDGDALTLAGPGPVSARLVLSVEQAEPLAEAPAALVVGARVGPEAVSHRIELDVAFSGIWEKRLAAWRPYILALSAILGLALVALLLALLLAPWWGKREIRPYLFTGLAADGIPLSTLSRGWVRPEALIPGEGDRTVVIDRTPSKASVEVGAAGGDPGEGRILLRGLRGRSHCFVEVLGGGTLTPIPSPDGRGERMRNGTYGVNRVRRTGRTPLAHGDRIDLAPGRAYRYFERPPTEEELRRLAADDLKLILADPGAIIWLTDWAATADGGAA